MLVALEVGLILAALGLWSSLHIFHAKQASQLGWLSRVTVLNGFWILPPGLLLLVWLPMLGRDAFRLFFDKTGVPRSMATVAAGLVVGGLLSFVYYPALAAQLSPKEVFESYQRFHKGGEPLGSPPFSCLRARFRRAWTDQTSSSALGPTIKASATSSVLPRIARSRRSVISGFSRKKVLAFSRPWPIRTES